MKTLFPTNEGPPASGDAHGDYTPESLSDAEERWDLLKIDLSKYLDEESFSLWISPLRVASSGPSELKIAAPTVTIYRTFLNNFLPMLEQCQHDLGMEDLIVKVILAQDETSAASAPELSPPDAPRSTPDSGLAFDPLIPELAEAGAPPPPPPPFQAAPEDESRIGVEIADSFENEEDPTAEAPEEPGPENAEDSDGSSFAFSRTLSRIPKLNPTYTFETFVRGPSNQFALATCQNIADNPGVNYNPLFLYGSTGLGKTHLLHAVGNQVMRHDPEAVVSYISSERFMNEMIYCIRHNKMWDFRQKYRHCDVFMMDDIQFISGNKAATQEEFFHTFNTLYEAKKQIIITSDLFPQDIPDIEERLRNRFQWGLIADIQPPDVEHRIAILYNKAEKLGVNLTHDVAEYIANHAKRNVRELEGALHRIAAFAALHGRPLDYSLARETFQSMVAESSSPSMDIDEVQKAVANHFGIRVADLKSRKRLRALTVPRQIAMYLARRLTSASYPEIGQKFGGKDHTTVIHAVKKVEIENREDLDVRAHIESLQRHLEQLST